MADKVARATHPTAISRSRQNCDESDPMLVRAGEGRGNLDILRSTRGARV